MLISVFYNYGYVIVYIKGSWMKGILVLELYILFFKLFYDSNYFKLQVLFLRVWLKSQLWHLLGL